MTSATLASYRRRLGYAAPPWGIDLLLTDACNLRCTYCPIWGENSALPAPAAFMDTGGALRLIDSVAGFHPMIRLFGGEPFLHPEWPRIVAAVRARGLHCTAVSNGMRLAREAEEVVRSGLLAVGISLDTNAPVNDALRGDGSLATVRRGIQAVTEAKRRLGSDTPGIEIYTTVHEGTYARLVEWAAELSSWGIAKLRLQHLIWFSSAQRETSFELLRGVLPDPSFFRAEDASFCQDKLPRIDLEILAEQLRILRATPHPFVIESHPDLSVDEMVRYYGTAEYTRHDKVDCTTMESYAFVDPRGRLYPCLTLDMGNVFEEPFLLVWNGSRFRAFRRLIRREKRLPLCHRCPD
ncbi:MAG TPA: radical SAM protein [Thermoanaerobaculia bacterium]|jgi:MoaA/NifB/PqqE/SkfB family radical SAM enzyme|nr:radical SAM protein [Thermoanaerobaculia bacterium]